MSGILRHLLYRRLLKMEKKETKVEETPQEQQEEKVELTPEQKAIAELVEQFKAFKEEHETLKKENETLKQELNKKRVKQAQDDLFYRTINGTQKDDDESTGSNGEVDIFSSYDNTIKLINGGRK